MFIPWLNTHFKKKKKILYSPRQFDSANSPASMFALVIGIDQYMDSQLSTLSGAVNDAEAVQTFLISKLSVPKERIVNLRNEQATRKAIIIAIQRLATNPVIGPDDPILIYYAGHGGRTKSPFDETNAKEIEMLLPYDFAQKGSVGRKGQGLFDVTISSLLTHVANNKSNNITVILDCCHSGSGTREAPDEPFTSRGVTLPPSYTVSKAIFKAESNAKVEEGRIADAYKGVSQDERASGIPSEYEMYALRSHVLLSACKKDQTAKEERSGRGVFTLALLHLLGENVNAELTYKDIIQWLKLEKTYCQNPQCEGINQNRKIFTSKIIGRFGTLHTIHKSKKPGVYNLQVGEAHGIARNAQFAVFADAAMTRPIGSIIAQKIIEFETQCAVLGASKTLDLTGPGYAVQTRAGEESMVRIYIKPKDSWLSDQISKQKPEAGYRSFCVVRKVEDPDLILSTRGDFVQFDVTNTICRQHGLTRMLYDNPIHVGDTERLRLELRRAAHFYWNLRHTASMKGENLLTDEIHLECFKVAEPKKQGRKPVGDNLVNIDGAIYIDTGDEAQSYGFKIRNDSMYSLYASLFYFDVNALRIETYHLPVTAAEGGADFCLPSNGFLCIGFGDSGSTPYEYFLRDMQKVDVGFLKLYLSTQFVDFSTLVLPKAHFNGNQRASRPASLAKTQFWATITVPIIQKGGQPRDESFARGPEEKQSHSHRSLNDDASQVSRVEEDAALEVVEEEEEDGFWQ